MHVIALKIQSIWRRIVYTADFFSKHKAEKRVEKEEENKNKSLELLKFIKSVQLKFNLMETRKHLSNFCSFFEKRVIKRKAISLRKERYHNIPYYF